MSLDDYGPTEMTETPPPAPRLASWFANSNTTTTARTTSPPPPHPSTMDTGSDSPLPAPIHRLPPDALRNVLLRLQLRDAVLCRPVSRLFHETLSSQFLALLPTMRLLILRHPRPDGGGCLHAFDPERRHWLRLPFTYFLPYQSFSPVASSTSLLYLWVDTSSSPSPPALPSTSFSSSTAHPPKSLAVCNPFAGTYRLLPPLGSAWARHGTVLAGPGGTVLVLTDLAALSYTPSGPGKWMKHPLSLPCKPRSPILASGAAAVFALCDVGTPWRSQWKLFSCPLAMLTGGWAPVERAAWGDVFEILKRPRLLPGAGGRRVLMIGGLRSSFAIDAPCSTVLILRLDLATMEWDEAGRMPPNMYRCFTGLCEAAAQGNAMPTAAAGGNNKVKVFGGDGKVWFSGKRVHGKFAMWEEDETGSSGGKWDWMDGVPGNSDGVYRGFVLDGGFTAIP
ncbi:SKP1-interacting partner 15-like [Phragmites australis]|uniref:SKP1-interacting partner 15-like n=1 Tax=Phragmites australis TaxID=29695 RepID=UPI002D764E97|nr:SKP1-interacting partner 15-like [Phragmites australis]XP_062227217.1 SKP1-interacting partner 15-like [Phragmites australis]XP_062227218.1 SKP1-interacting partner 15-like [Phragmites australis]XP_062227220.1 SKP1-interacting partner 15-like [Phragmites australis]XP_062227221.1 SKP1-interacting partner 15-like [Phragmites australis]XP_062227222.1 SKP1-interacting partner 15-like [Phragmites australis]